MIMMMLMLFMLLVFVIIVIFTETCREAAGSTGHGIKDCLSGELIPWRGDDSCIGVQLTDDFSIRCELCFIHVLSLGKNNTGCGCDLIIEELFEIAMIHFAASGVDNGAVAVQFNPADCFHCPQDIGKLSDSRGLNDDPIRMICIDDLLQRLLEIAFQRAADAAAVDFADLNAGVFQESSVNTDFTEFIFYKDYLLAMEDIFDQF